MKGRARDKKSRFRATFTTRARARSRLPPVMTTAIGREKMSRPSRFAMHPSAMGPRCPDRGGSFTTAALSLCDAPFTFISIMTGEQLNLHGKSHRSRNEACPQIRNSRPIGGHTWAHIIFRILYIYNTYSYITNNSYIKNIRVTKYHKNIKKKKYNEQRGEIF